MLKNNQKKITLKPFGCDPDRAGKLKTDQKKITKLQETCVFCFVLFQEQS